MRGGEYSLSDIKAVTDGNNNNGFGGFGNDWAWIIVLFLIFGWGRNGFGGGYGNGGTSVYEGYVLNNDFSQLSKQISDTYNLTDRKFDSITNGICNLGYTQAQLINGIDKSILTTSNQTNANISNLGYNLQNCCCELKSQLADNKYEMAKGFCSTNNNMTLNTRDIIEGQNANTRAILDAITQNRIEDKNAQITAQQNEINALRLAASQERQNNLITQGFANEVDALYNRLSNCPVPTTPVYGKTPIFTCGCTNTCGCNNGCGY